MPSPSPSKALTSRPPLLPRPQLFVSVSPHAPPIDPELLSAAVCGLEGPASALARQGGSNAGVLRDRGKMALDGPEQVWWRRGPGGHRGWMRSRRDPRGAAGRGERVGWLGVGRTHLDRDRICCVSAARRVRAGPGEDDTVEAEREERWERERAAVLPPGSACRSAQRLARDKALPCISSLDRPASLTK